MNSMAIMVNDTVLNIWKLLREQILKVLTTRKKKNCCNSVWFMLTTLIGVITLKHTQISYHDVVHLKLYHVCQLYLNFLKFKKLN